MTIKVRSDSLAQKNDKKDKKDDLLRAGIAGALYETIQRYGSAAKEHLVGYSHTAAKGRLGGRGQGYGFFKCRKYHCRQKQQKNKA